MGFTKYSVRAKAIGTEMLLSWNGDKKYALHKADAL